MEGCEKEKNAAEKVDSSRALILEGLTGPREIERTIELLL